MLRAALPLLALSACPSPQPAPPEVPTPEASAPSTPNPPPPVASSSIAKHLRAGLVGEDVNDTREIMAIELNLIADGRLEMLDKSIQPPQRTDLLTGWPEVGAIDHFAEAALVHLDDDTHGDLVLLVADGPATAALRIYLDVTEQPHAATAPNAVIVGIAGSATSGRLAHAPGASLYVWASADPQQAVHLDQITFDVGATSLAPFPTVAFDWNTLNPGL